ncbi:MAG: ABC transporter permease [Bacteroidota bacterium]
MFGKIGLVISREYLTRVRKKSFIVMTILTPLLVLAFYGIIFYFAINRHVGEKQKVILVDDRTGFFDKELEDTRYIKFQYGLVDKESEQSILKNTDIYAILRIPPADNIDEIPPLTLIAEEQVSMSTQSSLENMLKKIIKDYKLKQSGISSTVIQNINKASISINSVKYTAKGAKSGSATASTAIGYISAILIYLFIFLYGVQVMRGVIEEKSNRIIEVIISSLKPFELMMGKIAGIALVGLTQFIIWLVLFTLLGSALSGFIYSAVDIPAEAVSEMANSTTTEAGSNEMASFLNGLAGFNFVQITLLFLFYFVTGYLFYGALFAAVGSAVDNETDTQQFMLPITLPLVFAFILAQSVVTSNPNGALAFWLSMIPLTSPVVMMVRIPFGVAWWELAISMSLMVAGFVFTVWLAARIYRIGILMYGKKVGYKELSRWLFVKN